MCKLFSRCECTHAGTQDARAEHRLHTCILEGRLPCGRAGIWHCAAYYPRMHEMPCHLHTGHARSTLSRLLRCRCCCYTSPQSRSYMFRGYDTMPSSPFCPARREKCVFRVTQNAFLSKRKESLVEGVRPRRVAE